jgi:hypothetical protein
MGRAVHPCYGHEIIGGIPCRAGADGGDFPAFEFVSVVVFGYIIAGNLLSLDGGNVSLDRIGCLILICFDFVISLVAGS